MFSGIQDHYIYVHKVPRDKFDTRIFERVLRIIYGTIGVPKRYRNGCSQYFTPELRNAISHIQDSILTKLCDGNKYDMERFEAVEEMLEAQLKSFTAFVGDLVPACVKTLDKLSEAGIIKKTKSKQQKENVEIK
jgi:FMN phosphatase YigB (HAD superfamily)